MANFQIIGDKQKLSTGPKNENPHNGPNGTYQMVGECVKMSATPVPLQEGKSGGGGAFQNVGDKVSMSSTPHHGWASASTPPSERAIAQSNMPGLKKGK